MNVDGAAGAPRVHRSAREPLILLLLMAAALVISGIHPYDRVTWVLEVFPILLGVPILVATWRRFPLTPLVYRLLFLHALILMVGGHYTYARVPLGFWVQDLLGLARNHYDRLGHFVQGFVPAILAREVLIRRTPLRPGGWLFFLVTSVCLAVSATYELVEWWSAVIGGSAANDFLGTQGDVWDTQWDMFIALIGALTAQLTLSRVHDRELATFSTDPEEIKRRAIAAIGRYRSDVTDLSREHDHYLADPTPPPPADGSGPPPARESPRP
jgi:putative membrane protein